MKTHVIFALSAVLLFTLGLQTTNYAEGQVIETTAPTYLNIDISARATAASDYPFGMACDDSTYRVTALFSSGAFVKINRADNTYTIYDNNAIAAGEDWYSVLVVPSVNKAFANQKDSGKLVQFNMNTNTYGSDIPIPANIAGGNIGYTTTYAAAPNDISISGGGTYHFGFDSFGELKFTNGYVWELIDYVYDFSNADNLAGSADVTFHGIARIDPDTGAVTRYAIAGASALRGISVDVTDSTILWITDITGDKLFKFDTDTGLVVDTISFSAGTKPRGVTNNSDSVYIAMNQAGGSGNSKIMKVLKSDYSTSEIDTTALNSAGGAFSVYVVDTVLFWTDESSHIGTILISNPTTVTVTDTSSETSANHFGCVEENKITFAGHGSAKVGSFTVSVSDSARGDDCKGDCYAPNFGNDQNNMKLYSDGLTINGESYEMANVLHVHHDKIIEVPVGKDSSFILKINDMWPEQIRVCEIGLGLPKGHFIINDAQTMLTMRFSFDGHITESITGDTETVKNVKMTHYIKDGNTYCEFDWIGTKRLNGDMFAVQAIDEFNYNKITFVNEGYNQIGESLVGTPVFTVMDRYDHDKLVKIAILDETLVDQTKAIAENGDYWTLIDGKWSKDLILTKSICNLSKHGYDRYCNEFKIMKHGQELIAAQYFDSSAIQSVPQKVTQVEYVNYPRLHDSVSNMDKARMEYEVNQVLRQ